MVSVVLSPTSPNFTALSENNFFGILSPEAISPDWLGRKNDVVLRLCSSVSPYILTSDTFLKEPWGHTVAPEALVRSYQGLQ